MNQTVNSHIQLVIEDKIHGTSDVLRLFDLEIKHNEHGIIQEEQRGMLTLANYYWSLLIAYSKSKAKDEPVQLVWSLEGENDASTSCG